MVRGGEGVVRLDIPRRPSQLRLVSSDRVGSGGGQGENRDVDGKRR